MGFTLPRTKKLWLVAVFTVLVSGIALSSLGLSGGTTQMSAESEKDYTGVPVSSLPLDEQIKVARSVELSAVVNWGEGGPMYREEVAEAFLLGYPFLDYLEKKYGKGNYEYIFSSPETRAKREVAFLTQVGNRREIWFSTRSGTYQVNLQLENNGTILASSISFSDGIHPFEVYIKGQTK